MVEPSRAVTAPCSLPKVTLLLDIDTPPLKTVPSSLTTSEAFDPWSCMESRTSTSPALFGLDVWIDPVAFAVKGAAGTELIDEGMVVLGTVALAAGKLACGAVGVANLALSWASNAEDVPERNDQPGWSGPARLNTPIPMTTAVVTPAAATRRCWQC